MKLVRGIQLLRAGSRRFLVSSASDLRLETVNEPQFNLFFTRGGKRISPWHDIDLYHAASPTLLNFVNEIPKNTSAKMEIATKVPHNPIRQDLVKKTGALRFFTYGNIPFNYGCLPRTWEDPNVRDSLTSEVGDNDPIDVVEISPGSIEMGGVRPIRVLGALALLDEGETDWKIIAVEATQSNDTLTLADVPHTTLETIYKWFKFYKTTDGKPENRFAFDDKQPQLPFLGKEVAMKVVAAGCESYNDLITRKPLADGASRGSNLWTG